MLLVGTTRSLEDLDRQYSLAEDVTVTAIATNGGGVTSGGAVYVLLDGSRVATVGEFHLDPLFELDGRDAQSMAAGDSQLVIGTQGAHLLAADVRQRTVHPVASFDEVDGRATWHNPAAPSPDSRSVTVTDTGSWLVNVHVGGVWRSTDEGASWANVVTADSDVHEVVAGTGGRVAVAAARGFGWSLDDGVSWQWTDAGLHAPYARAVAVDGDAAYVTASTGPQTADGRLYRGTLGASFELCSTGLPGSFPFNLDTGSLTAGAGSVGLGTRDGRVYRSHDAGSTFELVVERLAPVRVARFV